MFNKPKIFLSHSKKDIDFIKKVKHDFDYCKIDTWLDEIDIQHGESWLDQIFENGMPTCNAVLVYITENSISSPMVKKEIDSAIISKFKDSNVNVLLYVENESIRNELRVDLRSLHCPVWNTENYHVLLPKIVSEIYITYMSKQVELAVQSEKIRRLQAESELKDIKNSSTSSPFTPSEESEFEYIYNNFNMQIEIHAEWKWKADNETYTNGIGNYYVDLGKLMYQYEYHESGLISNSAYDHFIQKHIKIISQTIPPFKDAYVSISQGVHIVEKLLTYGIVFVVEDDSRDRLSQRLSRMWQTVYKHYLSDKFHRYRFWLEYNKKYQEDTLFIINK